MASSAAHCYAGTGFLYEWDTWVCEVQLMPTCICHSHGLVQQERWLGSCDTHFWSLPLSKWELRKSYCPCRNNFGFILVRNEFIILATLMSGDAQDSCVYCLNCSSVVTVAFEQFSFPAATTAAPAAGNPTAGNPAVLEKTAGETQWMCEQPGCAEPLLCLHSF